MLPGVGAPPSGQGPLSEPVLLAMVNQVAAMQQQMFDQFQQTIMGMAQMFGSLHKDQAGVIREELQHLRELSLELNQLQGQTAKHPPTPLPGPQVPPQGTPPATGAAVPAANGLRSAPAEMGPHRPAASPAPGTPGAPLAAGPASPGSLEQLPGQ